MINKIQQLMPHQHQCECQRQNKYHNDTPSTDKRCAFTALVEVNGVKMCRKHAQTIAFELLMQQAREPSLKLLAERQLAFSSRTFGPGTRFKGIIKHIVKELRELLRKPNDIYEWADVILLAIDGALRQGHSPADVSRAVTDKLSINERREWPDWRCLPDDVAVEHVRKENNNEPRD